MDFKIKTRYFSIKIFFTKWWRVCIFSEIHSAYLAMEYYLLRTSSFRIPYLGSLENFVAILNVNFFEIHNRDLPSLGGFLCSAQLYSFLLPIVLSYMLFMQYLRLFFQALRCSIVLCVCVWVCMCVFSSILCQEKRNSPYLVKNEFVKCHHLQILSGIDTRFRCCCYCVLFFVDTKFSFHDTRFLCSAFFFFFVFRFVVRFHENSDNFRKPLS